MRLVVAIVVAFGAPTMTCADVVVSDVVGAFAGAQENGCVQIALTFFRVDCSYDRRHPAIGEVDVPWLGPTVEAVYFPVSSPSAVPSFVPYPGDSRIPPSVAGTIAVDDRQTESALDDLVSLSLTLGPVARSVTSRSPGNKRLSHVVETWTSATQRMAPTAVSAAVRNDSGGFDYVIGSRGFPTRICSRAMPLDCFPSANAPAIVEGKGGVGFWAAPGTVAIGRAKALGDNAGGQTIADFDGYVCASSSGDEACRAGVTVWGASAAPGWDNVVMKVVTDRRGRVTQAQAYWTIEYRAVRASDSPSADASDSWMGGFIELQGS